MSQFIAHNFGDANMAPFNTGDVLDNGSIAASSKKIRYYSQPEIKDPYAQISNSGFTPIGNIKSYNVANMYDRPEPTNLRDLQELYTIPHNTTPFLGTNTTSIKYIDEDSTKLRYPAFLNKKSTTGTSQISYFPQQHFMNNPGVSNELNTFYEQATTINMAGNNDQTFESDLDSTKPMLGQVHNGQVSSRYVNRWNIVDPRIVQNVNNIIMNSKDSRGNMISLKSCGISTRNELRNYAETNNC